MKTLSTATLLTLLLLGLPFQTHAAPQLSLGTANLSPGQTGALTLTLSGGVEPYAGVNAKILLPDGVTVTGLAKGQLLSSSFATDFRTFNDPQTGVTLIAYSGSETIRASSGALLTLQLQTSDTAAVGEYSAAFAETNIITAVNSRYALSDDGGTRSITPAVNPGTIRIGPPGDADGDGLPDAWEQQIIDADPTDAIATIQDVSPDDDFDGDGLSNQAEYDGNTDPTVIDFTLTPPSGIAAKAGIDSIRITWEPDASAYIEGYNVYRSLSGTGPFTKVNNALIDSAGNNYTDTLNLVEDSLYYYQVMSIDTSGIESDPSETVSVYFGRVTMFMSDSNGVSGAEVLLPVNIDNADNLKMCSVEFYITYDPKVLSAKDIQATALTIDYGWAKYFPEPGVVRAAITNWEGSKTLFGEGSLFYVVFDVIGNSGETSPLDFDINNTDFWDCRDIVNEIDLDLSDSGIFTVTGDFILGDVNGDGVVSYDDVQLTLDIVVGQIKSNKRQEEAGDVSGNGKIQANDATMIEMIIAGVPLPPKASRMARQAMRTTVNLSVPTTYITAGETAWVPILIDNAQDIASAQITLNYDPTFITATDVRTTSMTQGAAIASNLSQDGQVRMSMLNASGAEASGASGALLEVQFTVDPSVYDCVSFPVSIADAKLYDDLGRDFEISALQTEIETINGNIVIATNAIKNLDQAVTALKLLAGIDCDICNLPPDATGEGKVDLREVIMVLQTVAGIR